MKNLTALHIIQILKNNKYKKIIDNLEIEKRAIEHGAKESKKYDTLLDEVIKTIRKSKNKTDAIENLMHEYEFTKAQAEAKK